LWQNILVYLQNLWNSLQTISTTVATKVSEINKWFSNEFIDPFIDWLVKLPENLWKMFDTTITGIGKRIESWLTTESPGFIQILKKWWDKITQWLGIWGWALVDTFRKAFTPGTEEFKRSMPWVIAVITTVVSIGVGAIVAAGEGISVGVVAGFRGLGSLILKFAPMLGSWFLTIFSKLGGWLLRLCGLLGASLVKLLPGFATWAAGAWLPVIASGAVLALEATGKLEPLIDKFITPALTDIFSWAESLGPVAPTNAASISGGLTKLTAMTISGLAAMTIGGELLSPFKQIGLGNISAIIYDLINYRTLTAAFMGVLAYVYIRTPLTYYYNRAARPNIPSESQLTSLAGEYAITRGEFDEAMSWHGYPDKWIERLYELADRPLTPYMFRSMAEQGILDDELLDRELRNASYNEKTIPYLKQLFHKLAQAELKTIMTSSALNRYKEGLDDVGTLQKNLTVLGVDPSVMPIYVYAANLNYITDYQTDVIAYYKDAYHRREIEEPELRSGLASAGLLSERIDINIERERIKRLKAPAPTPTEVSTVKIDTIRRKRRKFLITREEEVAELIKVGVSTDDAIAYADNDEVRLAEKAEGE
jgi:hypothetical protein